MSDRILRIIGHRLQPHLSKILRSRREPAKDWRLFKDDMPPPLQWPTAQTIHNAAAHDELETARRDARRSYRILCLDGGGVRGVLTAVMLQRILDRHPHFMNEVDFICGTSAGGILSLLLSAGYTPSQCIDIYSWSLPHIFGYNPWRIVNPFRSRYSDKAKEELMKEYFGDLTMKDLKKTCSVIAFRLDGRKSKTHTFFDREGWRPAVFSNMPKNSGLVEPDLDLLVYDAAMRTSAAPTYFPVHKGYVDGGIVANNPSIIAASKVLSHYPTVNTRNLTVLSLGAGTFPRHTNIFSYSSDANIKYKTNSNNGYDAPEILRADWGIKQWIPYLMDLLLDGDTITVEMVMHYLLGNAVLLVMESNLVLGGSGLYHRLPRQIPLDDVLAIEELKQFGAAVDMTSTFDFIDKYFLPQDLKSYDHTMITNTLDHATPYNEAWIRDMSKLLQDDKK